MFGKKSAIDTKKATQKFLDSKKDTTTRLKHLKSILETVDASEAKTFFITNYSCVYYVFYDQFITLESNLKQRVQKAYREELDVVLSIFEKILTLLPELLSRKWQCHSIGRLMKKLLHPNNALKLRREAMRLFLLWYQILGENASRDLHWIFACLVPGFHIKGENGQPITLEMLISGTGFTSDALGMKSVTEQVGPLEIAPILPPQSGDRQLNDLTKFFLECLMDFMVTQVTKIEWKDKSLTHQQKCFQFLFDKFKKYYLPTIFSDFNWRTSLYTPCLDLPEMRSHSLSKDAANANEVVSDFHLNKESLLHCKVVVIRWVAMFTLNFHTGDIPRYMFMHHRPNPEESEAAKENKNAFHASSEPHVEKIQSSVLTSSSYTEKESNYSYNGNEDHTFAEHSVVRDTLYASRENVNFVHEVFRQTLLLSFSEAATMRRVIAVYREWITSRDPPPFMLEANENIFGHSREEKGHHKIQNYAHLDGFVSNVDQNVLSRSCRLRNDSYLGAIHRENLNVRAGLQNTLQVFVTNAANVFLQEIIPERKKFLDDQVDMCKRVLNIYRFIVMNVTMEQKTWEQLLMVLLHITSQILGESLPARKEDTLGGRLAPALFQTLIVTWIKANLNVVISIELWDQFTDVLSSLTHWEELIREWAKTMETLTRVLARLVYNVDLNDLPLDRLSEQKQKKRRGRLQPAEGNAASFSRGWGKHGSDGSRVARRAETDTPDSSLTTSGTKSRSDKGEWGSTRNRSNSGDGDGKGANRGDNRSERGVSILRSASEGNLASRSRSVSITLYREPSAGPPDVPLGRASAAAEEEVAKILAASEEYMKGASTGSIKSGTIRKTKSMDSLRFIRASTPSSLSESSVDGPSRSPSPSPSTGLESSSIKDSPMQIDVVGGENSCPQGLWDGNREELRSVMSGGNVPGWLPDVAVVLWRRMLGALGDVNDIADPEMHAQVFQYLVELFETLVKIRDNQGVSSDNQSTPAPPELIPHLNILAPWLFKAMTLSKKYKKGKLSAYRLLCSIAVRRHDVTLPRDHLVQFYGVLHNALGGTDQEVINTIVKYCGPRLFLKSPGSLLLMLDFIYAADTIASSLDLKEAPRTEAMSILGAMVSFPNVYIDMPILQPNSIELTSVDRKSAKDHVVSVLLKAGRREPAGLARCVALSSLGIYLYEELAHASSHGKMRDAINVLLAALRITNKIVGQVACDILRLLTDHTAALMRTFPDVPKRIIEVIAATLSTLLVRVDGVSVDGDREHERLVMSMMFCLGEWCMHIKQSLLTETTSTGESLLLIVFKVLNSAVHGNFVPLQHNYVDPSGGEFELNIQLNNLQEGMTTSPRSQRHFDASSPEQIFTHLNPMVAEGHGAFSVIKLAARTVMTHLINHLGHFPMGIGAARLTSMVNESDDIPGLVADDLSSDVFLSPNVQVDASRMRGNLRSSTWWRFCSFISFVELKALEVPGGGVTAGLTTGKSQVRVILRDMSGKFSWDASVLYGPPGCADEPSENLIFKDNEPDSLAQHREMEEFLSAVNQANPSAHAFSMRHRPSHVLPVYEDSEEDMDNLNDLLQYVGYTSPECLYRLGQPLNIPQELPPKMCPEVQEDIMTTVLNQRNSELDYLNRHKSDICMMGKPVQPSLPCDPTSPFQLCRLFVNQLGLMAWEKRTHFDLLKKNEKLLRELRNLDSQKCRETHKIAVIYVAEGQEDKNSVLMNSGGAQAYEEFVAGLAWEVELQTHTGFMGGLRGNGSNGDTAPYYSTSFMEVIFHVATRMPSQNEESLIQKLRHLGNDEVHIVWSEHNRDYRRGIITTEFGDVLIVIYPLPNKLYRIQISRKPQVPFFGPLFDGAIVDHRVLSGLVRATAINASRATRSTMPIYQHFYKERAKALETIIKNHKDLSTFEEFTSNVFMPAKSKTHYGACGASGLRSDSTNMLALSNLAAALLDSQSRQIGGAFRNRPSSLSSSSDQSTPVNVSDSHHKASESLDSGDSEEFKDVKVISPKTSKRLSFKSNAKKAQSSRPVPTPPESPPPKSKK